MITATKEAMPHPRVHPQADTSAIEKIAVFIAERYSRAEFTKMIGDGSYLHLQALAQRLYQEHKNRSRVKAAFGRLVTKSEICHVNVFCLALCEIKQWRAYSMIPKPAEPMAS